MTVAPKLLTKRLDEVVPPEVAWCSRESLTNLLNVSESQLKRDTAVLQELYPEGWERVPYARGYSRSAVEVLWQFRQMVKVMGRLEAIKRINKHMEDFWNECK